MLSEDIESDNFFSNSIGGKAGKKILEVVAFMVSLKCHSLSSDAAGPLFLFMAAWIFLCY